MLFGVEWGLQGGGNARIVARGGHWFVGDEFGLKDELHLIVERFHLVGDRGDGPPGEGDQAGGAHAHGLADRRGLFAHAVQQPAAQIQHPLV
ncbi:hypothetical protein GCM10022206_23560 [Streptomyces chiangmaiensis]